MISSYSFVFSLICIFIAILTTYCMGYFYKATMVTYRVTTIDGLRGYLSFFFTPCKYLVWFVTHGAPKDVLRQ